MRSLFTKSAVTLPSRAERSKAGFLLPFNRATDSREHRQPPLRPTNIAVTL